MIEEQSLPALSPAALAEVVRVATGYPRLTLSSWRTMALHHAHEATAGVYRIAGDGDANGESVPWSVVLKVVHTPPGSETLREVAAYRSGLLSDLPGIRAPRCYHIEERGGGAIGLWLEDIATPGDWPLTHFGLAARHFGRFNGAYLVDRPLPGAPWMNRDLLRTVVAQRQATMVARIQQAETWAHPLARQMFPAPIASRLLRL